jgi:hypothetical protein
LIKGNGIKLRNLVSIFLMRGFFMLDNFVKM